MRGQGPCKCPAGFRTVHPGEGACWRHGGLREGDRRVKSRRYSQVRTPRLRELAEAFEAEENPLDLLPELAQLRGLYVDYVNRFEAFQRALFDWHASYQAGSDDPAKKPRQLLDLSDAARLVSEITKAAKRIEDVRAHQHIGRADFMRVLSEMGRVVDRVVQDSELRERIHEGWLDIRLA